MNTQLKAMKKTGLLLLFLWAFIQIQAIHFRHIGMKEGLSQLSVMAIYQDKLGRMWFGTEEGRLLTERIQLHTNLQTTKLPVTLSSGIKYIILLMTEKEMSISMQIIH